MLLTAAETYILQAIGAQNDSNLTSQADNALAAAMEMFIHRNDWSFLLRDTGQSFTVAGCATNSNTTVTTTTTNGFKDVLVGMTVSSSDSGIPAGTTVSAKASNTSLTLSAAATTTDTGLTFTFGGTIPIIAGTDSYNIPSDFWKPYSCRFTSSLTYPLQYIPQSQWDEVTLDQSVSGSPRYYTIYRGSTFDATGTQQTKIKFFRPPQAADVCLFRYYRYPDPTATTVDWSDRSLYALLEYARYEMVVLRNGSADPRARLYAERAEQKLAEAIRADREEGGADEEPRFVTPNERQPIGGGPPFWPWGDHGNYW